MAKSPATNSGGSNEYVTLTDHSTGKSYDYPMIPGTTGPKVIDIGKLYGETGHFTYDPGYTCTGACESKLTYIDGEVGILMHKGYLIEDLAEKSDYMELCYMLLEGELPNKQQKEEFVQIITEHTMLHEQLKKFY
ncbi:MAG: citrate/2-methylcitrate synthase, partial [Alphaproteobacteria bacterium]